MFKFNFQILPENLDKNEDTSETTEHSPENQEPEINWYDSMKVTAEDRHFETMDVYRAYSTSAEFGSIEIFYLLSECVAKLLKESGDDTKTANDQHSDLVPGVYEGGAKIWECTVDALKYLSKHSKENYFKGKRVLDLGCGAGLLGIFALKSDSYIEFQDYNQDVLQTVTIPNILLNLPGESDSDLKNNLSKTSFYSGDWEKYAELTKNDEKFDFMLTSETIYNMKNYRKLINVFKTKLKPNGIIYLAAKVYYFGVGGGLRQFEEYLKSDGVFSWKSVWESTTDVHREILEIRFKDYVR